MTTINDIDWTEAVDSASNLQAFIQNRLARAIAEREWNLLLYGNHGLPYPRYNHMLDLLREEVSSAQHAS